MIIFQQIETTQQMNNFYNVLYQLGCFYLLAFFISWIVSICWVVSIRWRFIIIKKNATITFQNYQEVG